MPHSIISSNGHFRVHYHTTGSDAVAALDANGNSVPDYIDSVAFYMEYAWEVEINEYHYDPPPVDNRNAGMGDVDEKVDVYVCDLPKNLYGGACPETNNIVDGTRVASYLVLDNDYSPADYPTPGIAGVRVTTAHEFHHVIQFGYRAAFPPLSNTAQLSIYEATAVWFEQQVHPEIPDYLNYVRPFLTAPQNYAFSTNSTDDVITGYAHELYMEYLSKRFGRDIIREIWEEFRTKNSFEAIDAALRKHNFNLENSWCEFAEWCYYTGSRAQDTTYFLKAASYPTMRAATTRSFTGAELVLSDTLYPLSFGLYPTVFSPTNPNLHDTADFLVTNARADIGPGGLSSVDPESFILYVDREPHADYTPLMNGSDTLAYYRLQTDPGSHFCLNPILNGSKSYAIAVHTSPQPFMNDGGSTMVFAIDKASELIRTIKVWIYSSSMARVVEIEQKQLEASGNLLGAVWNGRDMNGDLAPSGVYLYEISVNDQAPTLGKFAIVRR